MDTLILNTSVAGGALVMLSLLAWHPRLRVLWAIGLALLATIVGGLAGVLTLPDLWMLPQWTGLSEPLLLLLLSILYGSLLRAGGGALSVRAPAWLVAPLAGALMGAAPAAALLSSSACDPKAAGRLAVAAIMGGLLSPLGHPALLLLTDRLGAAALLPLLPAGLVLCVIFSARRDDLQPHPEQPPRSPLLLLALTGPVILGVLAGHALAGLLLGCVLAAARAIVGAPPRSWLLSLRDPLLWGLGSSVLVLIATSAGLPEMMAWGSEEIGEQLGSFQAPLLAGVGAAASMLTGGEASALLATAMIDRSLDTEWRPLAAVLGAGLSVGSLTPLVAAGALRHGAPRLLLASILLMCWAALMM